MVKCTFKTENLSKYHSLKPLIEKNNEHHLSIIFSVWKLMAIKTSH